MVYSFGAPNKKHLEFTFAIKALSFHSRTSICGHKHLLILEIVILPKIKRRDFFSTRQHSYFGVTRCENFEVQMLYFRNEKCYGNGNL